MSNLTGSTTAVFFVRLSTAVDEIVDVDWNTRDGTAIAGNDYEAASGTVSFLPGETEKAIDVVVYGQDDVSANGKKFYIELKPPANAVLSDALAECVITVADEDGVLVTSLVIAQGKRGLKGNPGLSAYEQAVLMGYTGTVEQWMAEIGDASQAAERAEGYAASAASSATRAENYVVDIETAIIDPVTKNAVASKVYDASGQTQQQINDIFKTSQVVDTRLYGVVANTPVDMTPFIHDAFTDNPKARIFYFPEGEILCNIVIPRSYISLQGNGLGITKLIGFDGSKATINYNKKLYMGLKDISVHQKYDATASIINARDSRYIVYDEAEILQLPDTLGNYSCSVRGLDMRQEDAASWTGYNYFNRSRFSRCLIGVDIDYPTVASVCYFDNCILSWNGYFGAKLVGVEVGGMNNCDVATNGQIGVRDSLYDETQFGGVYIKGRYFHITGSWHEYNRSKFANPDVPNDIYIHPDSINVTETTPRSARNNAGGLLQSQSQAEQTRNAYSDTVIDSGLGAAKYQSLIKNGSFKHGLSGWTGINLEFSTNSIETVDLPKGYETGFKISSNTAGVVGLCQKIYQSGETTNKIIDLSKFIGKTLTATAWVKNISSLNALRFGFDTGAIGSGVYYSSGNFISQTPVGQFVKVTVTYKITGNEPRIMFGFRTIGSAIVTGLRLQLGDRVADYEPTVITEDGGTVYGTLDTTAFKIQGKNISFASTKPTTTGTIGDLCYNSNPTTGSAIGWVCTGGTTWLMIGRVIDLEYASSANFTSITSSLNTSQKWQGRQVMNSGTGKLYFATGDSAASAWRATDGSGDIIPS